MDSDIFEVLKVGGSVDIQRTDGKLYLKLLW